MSPDQPSPPYTEATAPIGVFSPALDAAVGAVREAGYPITVEQANALLIGVRAAAPGLIAAGRARAAADIRAHVERWKDSPNVSYHSLEVLRTAARVAEGDLSKGLISEA